MEPYVPAPRKKGVVSLDANESPFDLPAAVRKKFIRKVQKLVFNRYPDGPSTELRRAVGKKLGLSPDWIIAGNGSDELIGCLIDAIVPHRGTVVIPDPTFVMYERMARIRGAKIVKLPLDLNFDLTREFLDPKLLMRARLWFFAYPNNPTSNCFSETILLEILQRAKGVVVIDEAYIDFSGKTFLPRLRQYPNLVILRTFSKALGIALGRVGLALAHPHLARLLHVVRLPYNLSGLGQALALTTLDSRQAIRKNIDATLAERQKLIERLRTSRLFRVCPTDANFVLAQTPNPKKVFEFLRARGILIKMFNDPRLKSFVRMTVGRPAEMRKLAGALDQMEKFSWRE